ncbi:MAG: repressor LexA [Clostridiaceae bacterium]|nr:repressor LexA [Clostridiaceae bacterium]
MYSKLSPKQTEILMIINNCLSVNGYPPSIREICAKTGLKSTSSVHAHICTLERLGFIEKRGLKKRTLTTSYLPKHLYVPILGKIVDCDYILSVKNITGYYPVRDEFSPNKELFILKMTDDSMINNGILINDYILIQKQNIAKNGDIVAAFVDNKLTVKIFFNDKKNVRLQPSNNSYQPIIRNNIDVIGKAIGVFRTL